MSKLNGKAVSQVESNSHMNFMGGKSWSISDPFVKLRMIAASSFFGEPKYYDSDGLKNETKIYDYSTKIENDIVKVLGESLEFKDCDFIGEMEKAIDNALNVDIEKTLKIAVGLRNEDMIRSTPQVILVRASMHKAAKGTGLIVKYAPEICKRADEPAACLAYLFAAYGKRAPIPNSLKKALKKVLESFDEYSISKYKMENNIVKTRDVVNLVHAYSEPLDKLMKGKAKQFNTWENIVSNSNSSDKKTIWTEAARNMPHMALLRNLKNLIINGVDFNEYDKKLLNGVQNGKQLPFRYLSAYNVVKGLNKYDITPDALDLIEMCLKESLKNVPHFNGMTVCLSDNSGSTRKTMTSEAGTMQVNDIGNLMSVITCLASDRGRVGVFGDNLNYVNVTKTSSIIDLADKCNRVGNTVGQGTENGIWIFFRDAIENKTHYDNIFVYSDMQAGHGGLYGLRPSEYEDYVINRNYIDVPKLINKYRSTVNPNVMVYLVQTAGYRDILVPEYYDRTFILGGWSQNILKFAKKMEEIYNN